MKRIFPAWLLFSFVLGACAASQGRLPASDTPAPVFHFSAGQMIEVDTSRAAGFQALAAMFEEPAKISVRDLDAALDGLAFQAGFIGGSVQTQLFQLGGVDDTIPFTRQEFEAANPFVEVINRYVKESGEKNPLFKRLNTALRNGGELPEEERAFNQDLRAALAIVPGYAGITFRGGSLSDAAVNVYSVGKVVEERSFTSTSIQPTMALKFAGTKGAGRTPTLFIVKGFSGKPVSYFSEFAQENEILYEGGRSFRVLGRIESKRFKVSCVFLQEQ